MSRILINAPASGANLAYRVLDVTAGQGLLQMITANYVTNADVLNRSVFMRITGKSGNIVGLFASDTSQPANETRAYVWGNTGSNYPSADGTIIHIPMQSLILEGGDLIELVNVGMNSGDAWETALFTIVGGPESGRA